MGKNKKKTDRPSPEELAEIASRREIWVDRQLFKTRWVRVDWQRGPKHHLTFMVRFMRPHRLHIIVWRLDMRIDPIPKDHWRKKGRVFWRPVGGE